MQGDERRRKLLQMLEQANEPLSGTALARLLAWLRARRLSLKGEAIGAGTVLALAAMALLPFIWYFFTKNHSYIHAFYTSRNLAVSVFAACCLFLSFLPKNLYKPEEL